MGRRSLVEAIGFDRSVRARSSPSSSGAAAGRSRAGEEAPLAAPLPSGARPVASPYSQRRTSLTCTIPRGSSRDSRNSGTRDTPATSKVRSSSRIGSFSSTAMMSARGTMTSSTRSAPKRRMRSNISRSSAEKAWPSPAPLSSASRVARNVGAPGRPSRARSVDSQPYPCSLAAAAAAAWLSDFSCVDLTLMARSMPARRLGLHRQLKGVGVFESEARQNFRFQPLHFGGFRIADVVVAKQVQEPVHDQVLDMLDRLELALGGFAGHGLRGQHDVAEVAIVLPVGGGAWPERKRQHVGCHVLAPVAGIEPTQQIIAAKHDTGLAVARSAPARVAGQRRRGAADRRLEADHARPVAVLLAEVQA